MDNFSPYIITEADRRLDTAANLQTAKSVAQRYANDLGHPVFIVSQHLHGAISVEPQVDTAHETR